MAGLFGPYFAGLRRNNLGLSLRQFCLQNGLDPGNISRLERGKQAPPQSDDLLRKYANALGLAEGSDEWMEFFDRAAATRGEFPSNIVLDENMEAKLPILFRSIRDGQTSKEDLESLAETIRRS